MIKKIIKLFKRLFSASKKSGVDLQKKSEQLLLLKTLLKEGETIDKKTLHKFTAEGVEMKYCPFCKRWYSLDRFSKNAKNNDGLFYKCKGCVSAERNCDYRRTIKKRLSYAQAVSMLEEGETLDERTLHKFTVEGIEMKYCMHCERWLTLDSFYLNSDKKRDGLRCRCIECESKSQKEGRLKRKNKPYISNSEPYKKSI